MAWGAGGEELREQIKVELALARQPMYRLCTAAWLLRHQEKGPQMQALVKRIYDTFNEMEALLNR